MPDDPLAPLLANLARAKQNEAAAALDVRDRLADEAEVTARRERAERQHGYCKERTQNARLALHIRQEALTDVDFEPTLDPAKITGPEQSDI
jgi:hypothetical protein